MLTSVQAACLAALATGFAVLSFLGAGGRGMHRLRRAAEPLHSANHRVRRRRAGLLVIVVAVVLAMTAQVDERVLAIGCTGLAVAFVGMRLRAHRQRRAAAVTRRATVIEACGVLGAELRAGRTPQDALDSAATVCAELRPAAASARLAGDVGLALDQASAVPGAGGLAALAAAWRVAERSGSAFAGIVERIADSLRADDAVRRQVSAGLAGTRSTARLLAGLPLAGIALGYAVGASPLAFLTGSPIGWACLATGLGLAALGLAWVERLADSCEAGTS
jgi:tight adherence protein B